MSTSPGTSAAGAKPKPANPGQKPSGAKPTADAGERTTASQSASQYRGDASIAYRSSQISAMLHSDMTPEKLKEFYADRTKGQDPFVDISPSRETLRTFLPDYIKAGEGLLDRAAFFTEMKLDPAREEANYKRLYQPAAKPAESPQSPGSSQPATPSGTDNPTGRTRPVQPQPASSSGNTPATGKPQGRQGSGRPEGTPPPPKPSESGTGGRNRSMSPSTFTQLEGLSLNTSVKLPKFD